MKNYLNLIVLLSVLFACSVKEKKSFKKYGGMLISIQLKYEHPTFKEVLKNRLDYFTRINSMTYSTSEADDILKISFPTFLSENQLTNLLLAKGEFSITVEDSVYFNNDVVEKVFLDYGGLAFNGKPFVTVDFKTSFHKDFENFTINRLNQYIEVRVDTTVVMTPLIADKITTGGFSISVADSKDLNTDITAVSLMFPHQQTPTSEIVNRQLFLLSNDNQPVEISAEVSSLYEEARAIIIKNKDHLLSDLKSAGTIDQLTIKGEIDAFIANDLSGYLALTEITKVDQLKQSFDELKKMMSQYEAKIEMMELIESINELSGVDLIDVR
ncbi:MAG: hypothetical protein AAFQ94_19870 [Bacteroidota bacterium]